MAYTMTHIYIAERLYERFHKKMDYASYILGAADFILQLMKEEGYEKFF